jgi:hypothetical protein
VTIAPTAIGLTHGTPILTPRGPVAVEALQPGMLVLAVSGSAAPFQPVVAVEHHHHAGPMVRIRTGALADSAPEGDLLLPPGHAVLIDGALVMAGDLVDGHGVVTEPAGAPVPLVRLLLEAHDAVLAAGTAVETAAPDLAAAPCAPRVAPDATLRALLAWRAEAMGWAAPAADTALPPEVGTLRARLSASPLTPSVEWPPVKPLR